MWGSKGALPGGDASPGGLLFCALVMGGAFATYDRGDSGDSGDEAYVTIAGGGAGYQPVIPRQ
jgi:hypothetical protein